MYTYTYTATYPCKYTDDQSCTDRCTFCVRMPSMCQMYIYYFIVHRTMDSIDSEIVGESVGVYAVYIVDMATYIVHRTRRRRPRVHCFWPFVRRSSFVVRRCALSSLSLLLSLLRRRPSVVVRRSSSVRRPSFVVRPSSVRRPSFFNSSVTDERSPIESELNTFGIDEAVQTLLLLE